MQNVRGDVQQETRSGTRDSRGETSPQVVLVQGLSAQKGTNGTGQAGEHPGLRGSAATRENINRS